MSSDQTLPWHHRFSLGYSFDRTWNKLTPAQSGSQDQHTGTVSLTGQPLRTFSWSGQYSGRFLTVTRTNAADERPTDHLVSGAINWTPGRAFNASASRYFERAGSRVDQPGQRTDYWQGQASAEGRFYRQIRVFATVYRIIYTGAPRGLRYNDAYFLSFRGKPFAHADWSAELSLADRHGRQPERYGGNLNTHARLFPLANAQTQIGYTALMSSVTLDAFHVTEESYNTSLQYLPVDNMSLSATWSIQRNRVLGSRWRAAWSLNGSYRWSSLASASVNYSERQLIRSVGAVNPAVPEQRPNTLLASVMWWIGPGTTVNTQYTRQKTNRGTITEYWGVGVSTSF